MTRKKEPKALTAPKIGRPVVFETHEDLENAIDGYFEAFSAEGRPLTVLGMCVHIGICRDTLIEYGKKSVEFSDTVKKAKGIIEAYAEECLFTNKNTAGIIFNLKNNFGWKDKREIGLNSRNLNLDIDSDTDDPKELSRLYSEMINDDGEGEG